MFCSANGSSRPLLMSTEGIRPHDRNINFRRLCWNCVDCVWSTWAILRFSICIELLEMDLNFVR